MLNGKTQVTRTLRYEPRREAWKTTFRKLKFAITNYRSYN